MEKGHIVFDIEGMHCDHCVQRVQEALNAVAGTCAVRVSLGRAEVSFQPGACSPAAIVQAIQAIDGFDVVGFRPAATDGSGNPTSSEHSS